jgi:hypothetical protein
MRPIYALAVLAVASCAGTLVPDVIEAAGDPPAGPRRLQAIAEYQLAGAKSPAYDLRWAGEGSVFVATSLDQVAEHRLAAGLPAVRQLYPSPPRFGDTGMVYAGLAAGTDTLVVASLSRQVSWRPVAANPGGEVLYERRMLGHVEDLDLQGDRLAWIGLPAPAQGGPAPDLAGVAWAGRLSKDLVGPSRLLADDPGAVAGARLLACNTLGNGAVRFQPDGSLLVAPGFLEDILLLDPAGRQIRRWDARWFGVDTAADCARVSPEERQRLDLEPRAGQEWANKHQVIDEALSTPRGPALIVRRMEGGLPAWRLFVLAPAGVEAFDLPIRPSSAFDRVAGDVRGTRLALLVGDPTSFPRASSNPDRVVVMDLGETAGRR